MCGWEGGRVQGRGDIDHALLKQDLSPLELMGLLTQ